MEKRKIIRHSRVDRLAVFAPAVRTVVIEVWVDGSEVGHRVFPVLGIQAVVKSTFLRFEDSGDGRNRPPNLRKDLETNGWQRQSGDDVVEYDPILIDDDYAICTLDEITSSNTTYKIVPCPWPISEDEGRLTPIIQALTAVATERESRKASREPS